MKLHLLLLPIKLVGIRVIVAVIRAGYGLPAKCLGYMGLVWAEKKNNTHTPPITRQLCFFFLQTCITLRHKQQLL